VYNSSNDQSIEMDPALFQNLMALQGYNQISEESKQQDEGARKIVCSSENVKALVVSESSDSKLQRANSHSSSKRPEKK